MTFTFTILIFSFFPMATSAQQVVNEPIAEINANQLEESADEQQDNSENDYESQQLNYFIKHPIDINGSDVEQLPLLHPLLIRNLQAYRKLLGDLIDLHELQAVPGFSHEIIRSILPYVTVNKSVTSLATIRERFEKGEHTIVVRSSIVPELADGYTATPDQKFTGSRLALFLRYKYQFRNLLQYGFIADKDAGEKFLSAGHTPDFTSFHFFARRVGMIKSIALGDYTVNLGQGLIHWQSQAFHKSSSVISIKRQSEVLRPYSSAGEYNFNRGIGATICERWSEITVFLSRRNLTANVKDGVITSIISSGLHRTSAEINDKNDASLSTAGAAVRRKFKKGHIALNWVYYKYSLPLMKKDEPYNLYSMRGKEWRNYSADYSFTLANLHVFGELASDKTWNHACINGAMASLSKSVDMASVFRYISKSYQCIYGNAFTENTMPVNEYGFYYGISIRPHLRWKIDLYADIFSFPWLKYRLNAPFYGLAYLVQVTWKPDKLTEVYTRFRYRMKPLNIENDEPELAVPGLQIFQHWRTHFGYQLSRGILLRSRVEVCIFGHQFMSAPAKGYLFYSDVVFKPKNSQLSGNMRLQYFETDNYNSRIYAYENDLMFVSSTPSFYNNGLRYYINLKAKTKVKFLTNSILTANLKLATTIYNNLPYIGTGISKIPGNRILSIKFQIFLSHQ